MKVTCICRSPQKSSYLLTLFYFFIDFFNRVFGRFATRGLQKHDFFPQKSIWAHHKKCGFFFLGCFFSLGCFARFFLNRVFGRFVTRGVKNPEEFSAAAKKCRYLRHFFSSFHAPPWLCAVRCAAMRLCVCGAFGV
jgi:hypothetical protein